MDHNREIEGPWEEIRQHDSELAGHRVRVIVLPESERSLGVSGGATPTARELMRMSGDERKRVLRSQAKAAESHYRDRPDLRDFEAFGEDDLYDHPSTR
jgi:hypothetical protein